MSLEMFSNVYGMFSNVTGNNFNVGPYTACLDRWFISKRVYIESVIDRLVSIKTVIIEINKIAVFTCVLRKNYDHII